MITTPNLMLNLPEPGSRGAWATQLIDALQAIDGFLAVSHNSDGTLKYAPSAGSMAYMVTGLTAGNGVASSVAAANSAAINDTISQAIANKEPNGGVIVILPAGVYEIDSPIVLQSDVTLRGQGVRGSRATVIKPSSAFPTATALIESPNFSAFNQWMDGYAATAGVGYTPGAPAVAGYDPATRPVPERVLFSGVEGIHLDGSDICSFGIGFIGLECVVQNNTMRYFTTSGIKVGGWVPTTPGADPIPYLSLNNVINNNLIIKNAGTGVKMAGPCVHEAPYCADNRIQNNYIEGSWAAGVFSGGSNCRITQNHIFDCLNGVESRDSHEKFIIGNYIENINTHGILVYNGASWEGGLNAIITDNIIRNINTGQFYPGVDQAAANANAGHNVNVCIARAAILIHESAGNKSLDNVIISNNILRRDAINPATGQGWVDTPPAPFWNSTVTRGKVPHMVGIVGDATQTDGVTAIQTAITNNIAQTGIATQSVVNTALPRSEADISIW